MLKWWWVVAVSTTFGALGSVLNIFPSIQIPLWVWIAVALLGIPIAQFLAYHRIALDRDLLKRKLGDREQSQAILRQINDYIEKGNSLYQALKNIPVMREKEHLPPLREEISEWIDQVQQFIAKDYPHFSGQLMSDANLAWEEAHGSPGRTERVNFVARRVARLAELRDEVSRGTVPVSPTEVEAEP